MLIALRLSLILCLILTGIGLGAARGTVSMGGGIVLCTGDGIVVRFGVDDQRSGAVHICPDMALSVLAAVDLSGPDPVQQAGIARASSLPQVSTGRHLAPPAALARAPPGDAI